MHQENANHAHPHVFTHANWTGQENMRKLVVEKEGQRLTDIAAPGDLVEIIRWRGLYSHWVVYVGYHESIHPQKCVVHFGSCSASSVCVVPHCLQTSVGIELEEFETIVRNSEVRINNVNDNLSLLNPTPLRDVMNKRIRKCQLKDYHLIDNNCEHFARYCRNGLRISDQSNTRHEAMNGFVAVEQGGKTTVAKLARSISVMETVCSILIFVSIFLTIWTDGTVKSIKAPSALEWFGVHNTWNVSCLGCLGCIIFVIGWANMDARYGLCFSTTLVGLTFTYDGTNMVDACAMELFVEGGLTGIGTLFGIIGCASQFGKAGVSCVLAVLGTVALSKFVGETGQPFANIMFLIFLVKGMASVSYHFRRGEILNHDRAGLITLLKNTYLASAYGLTRKSTWFATFLVVSVFQLIRVAQVIGVEGIKSIFGLIGGACCVGLTGFPFIVETLFISFLYVDTNTTFTFGLLGMFLLILRTPWLVQMTAAAASSIQQSCMSVSRLFLGTGTAANFLSESACISVVREVLVIVIFLSLVIISVVVEMPFLSIGSTVVTFVAAVGLGNGAIQKQQHIEQLARTETEQYLVARQLLNA